MSFLGRVLLGIVTLFGTLIFEILLAMVIFTYLALNQQELFGSLVNLSNQGLTYIIDLIRQVFPSFTDAAFAGALGDLSARAFLLLVLGLFASGIIRMVLWSFRAMFRRDY